MKYSFMSFSCPDLSLDDLLALAKRLGYGGVEPRVEAKHQHGIEAGLPADGRAAARRKAEDAGVAFSCLATSCVYANPETTQKHIDDTRRYIDLAADIGAPRLRVFGGTLGKGLTRDQAIDTVSAALSAVADHAKARDVIVCMETHDDWCDPNHVAAVMRRVNHPAIAVNWDIMHPVNRGGVDMKQAFDILRGWIKHIHFHDGATTDGKYGLVPIGKGNIDHLTAVRLLQSMAYPDFLSGEWIGWESYETHLPRELKTMEEYENRK